MNLQNVTMKNVSDMSLHEFISKFSLNNTNHITNTSLVTPKRRFSFRREYQNDFIKLYCDAIESGDVYIDFDARTGHNHGTKFRIRDKRIPDLYAESVIL